MTTEPITGFDLTRFQFRRDRVIGDSQVRFDMFHGFALELVDGDGRRGLGFGHQMWDALPPAAAMLASFAATLWPGIEGQGPGPLIHRVDRPRGGNQRDATYGFGEALQVALWDLAAQQAGVTLAKYLGARREKVRAYASGLDFHMTDAEFTAFFARAAACGFDTFKIKIGHQDPDWDLHRLDLLRQTVGPRAGVMIDANEAWSFKEAAVRLNRFHAAGHELIWVEDPILRHDFDGLKALSAALPWTMVNAGEYLDVSGRTALLMARATDILNVHGRITEVMRTGWLASEIGIPLALGNTNLELGVHAAAALPDVTWLEYSFQNYDHLVETPIRIEGGFAHVPDRPGHGLSLSAEARTLWSAPEPLREDQIRTGPDCLLFQQEPRSARRA